MSLSTCRCCFSTDIPCKQLDGVCSWIGNQEIYLNMLSETFDIDLKRNCDQPDGICDVCICRLRDATSFKNQVLCVERRFQERLNKYEDFDRRDYSLSPFKHQEDSCKTELDDVEASKQTKSLMNGEVTIKNIGEKVMIGSTVITPHKSDLAEDKCEKVESNSKMVKKFIDSPSTVPENLRNKLNISAIVKYSNVTPFKNKTREGYVCFYCDKIYSDPAILREHSTQSHKEERSDYNTKFKSSDQHLKVDITDLKCTICSTDMNDLIDLKQHLVQRHSKKLFENNDKMLPFKLTKTSPLLCAVCNQTFETFKMLHQHMNTHYRNFVCDECNTGFVTLRRLKFHKLTHASGSFDCKLCEKVFQSKAKLNFHIRGVHQGRWKRNKCPHCPEKFTDYYKKQKHMVEAHNESKIEYRCNACDREFSTKFRLTNHTKSFHLQELHYQCNVCSQMFYARRDLQRHMPKHTEERLECTICRKMFASKTTLKQHSRTHLEECCAICGKSFKFKLGIDTHVCA